MGARSLCSGWKANRGTGDSGFRQGRIDEAAIAQWRTLSGQGVRIRPRALVTTALCRILLTDLFVHGIGGAIYDVLGDAVFGEFFGMAMPRYAVLTATLRLQDFRPRRRGPNAMPRYGRADGCAGRPRESAPTNPP